MLRCVRSLPILVLVFSAARAPAVVESRATARNSLLYNYELAVAISHLTRSSMHPHPTPIATLAVPGPAKLASRFPPLDWRGLLPHRPWQPTRCQTLGRQRLVVQLRHGRYSKSHARRQPLPWLDLQAPSCPASQTSAASRTSATEFAMGACTQHGGALTSIARRCCWPGRQRAGLRRTPRSCRMPGTPRWPRCGRNPGLLGGRSTHAPAPHSRLVTHGIAQTDCATRRHTACGGTKPGSLAALAPALDIQIDRIHADRRWCSFVEGRAAFEARSWSIEEGAAVLIQASRGTAYATRGACLSAELHGNGARRHALPRQPASASASAPTTSLNRMTCWCGVYDPVQQAREARMARGSVRTTQVDKQMSWLGLMAHGAGCWLACMPSGRSPISPISSPISFSSSAAPSGSGSFSSCRTAQSHASYPISAGGLLSQQGGCCLSRGGLLCQQGRAAVSAGGLLSDRRRLPPQLPLQSNLKRLAVIWRLL